MAKSIRIGTFNCNNLFSRWDFQTSLSAVTTEPGSAGTLHGTASTLADTAATPTDPTPVPQVVTVDVNGAKLAGVLRTFQGRLVQGKDPKERTWIARRIAVLSADVLAVQEIEDQDALDAFDRDELTPLGADYPYRVVVEGNDPRRIDVGLLSRVPLGRISSWRFRPDPGEAGAPIFSRDLLQAELLVPGQPIQLLINHLKSNFVPDEFKMKAAAAAAAHDAVNARRLRQCEAVVAIMRKLRLHHRVVVVGDMNDNPTSPFMAPLAQSGLVERITSATTIPGPNKSGTMVADKFGNLSPTTWTERFKGKGVTQFNLYDQIWTSPDLAPTAAMIMRRTQISGDGSDHDPSAIDVSV